jgi:hypothetical protein
MHMRAEVFLQYLLLVYFKALFFCPKKRFKNIFILVYVTLVLHVLT